MHGRGTERREGHPLAGSRVPGRSFERAPGSLQRTPRMSLRPAAPFGCNFFELLPPRVEAPDAALTFDAGLLRLREFDERIRLAKQPAAVLDNPATRS